MTESNVTEIYSKAGFLKKIFVLWPYQYIRKVNSNKGINSVDEVIHIQDKDKNVNVLNRLNIEMEKNTVINEDGTIKRIGLFKLILKTFK